MTDNIISYIMEDGESISSSDVNRTSGCDEDTMPENMEDSLPVHEAVFRGDCAALSGLLREAKKSDQPELKPDYKDKHGNTPLHLAVMLGRSQCTQLLLAHAAPVKLKNKAGWSALAESISYGDRATIASLLRRLKQQAKAEITTKKPDMIQGLRDLGDFCLDIKWDFSSWVPLVSRILPSDICKISKKGACLRLDTTLVDFNDMRWVRGDIAFIYNGDKTKEDALTVLDNQAKVYQFVRQQESELEFEDEVDLLMSSDIVAAQLSTKPITFTREKSGWIWKQDKAEKLGDFLSEFYSVSGMVLESRKRREHLSEEDLQKNKAILDSFSKGTPVGLEEGEEEIVRRESLVPPPPTGVSWREYISAPPGTHPLLGRKTKLKSSKKAFKATIAMSEDFPMKVEMLMAVLEVIAPQFKHFGKLREFIDRKLPPGFPMQVNIPVLPTVSAKVTFTNFERRDDIKDDLFSIPSTYKLDPNRFPDL